MLEDIS